MQYIPTRSSLDSIDRMDLSWPEVVEDLNNAGQVYPAPGFDTRLVVTGALTRAFVEPGTYEQQPARIIVGIRPRPSIEPRDRPTAAPVVGVETPAPKSTRRGGSGSAWPATWPELLRRLRDVEHVEVVRGGKHLAILVRGERVATLPVSGSDHRGVFNACTQLRAGGVDISR